MKFYRRHASAIEGFNHDKGTIVHLKIKPGCRLPEDLDKLSGLRILDIDGCVMHCQTFFPESLEILQAAKTEVEGEDYVAFFLPDLKWVDISQSDALARCLAAYWPAENIRQLYMRNVSADSVDHLCDEVNNNHVISDPYVIDVSQNDSRVVLDFLLESMRHKWDNVSFIAEHCRITSQDIYERVVMSEPMPIPIFKGHLLSFRHNAISHIEQKMVFWMTSTVIAVDNRVDLLNTDPLHVSKDAAKIDAKYETAGYEAKARSGGDYPYIDFRKNLIPAIDCDEMPHATKWIKT